MCVATPHATRVAQRKIEANLISELMEDRIVNTHTTPELRKKAGRALVECGLWLCIGFIGASGLAAGLLQLFDGEVKPLSALALAGGGSVLAAVSWWRGRTVLDIVGGAAAMTAQTSRKTSTSAASSGSASRSSSMQAGRSTMTVAVRCFAATQPEAP